MFCRELLPDQLAVLSPRNFESRKFHKSKPLQLFSSEIKSATARAKISVKKSAKYKTVGGGWTK
jgi:hypothetical protein